MITDKQREAIEAAANQLKSEYPEDVWAEGSDEMAAHLKSTDEDHIFNAMSAMELADRIYAEILGIPGE